MAWRSGLCEMVTMVNAYCVLLRTGHQAEHFTCYFIVVTACNVVFIILILLIKTLWIVEIKYHVRGQEVKARGAWHQMPAPGLTWATPAL